MIEKHHVLPCQRFKTDVPGVVLDIFRNVSVIRSGRFDLKSLSRQKPGEPDRSRRADLHLGKPFFLEISQQLEKRGKANLESVVLREINVGDGGEYLQASRLDETTD